MEISIMILIRCNAKHLWKCSSIFVSDEYFRYLNYGDSFLYTCPWAYAHWFMYIICITLYIWNTNNFLHIDYIFIKVFKININSFILMNNRLSYFGQTLLRLTIIYSRQNLTATMGGKKINYNMKERNYSWGKMACIWHLPLRDTLVYMVQDKWKARRKLWSYWVGQMWAWKLTVQSSQKVRWVVDNYNMEETPDTVCLWNHPRFWVDLWHVYMWERLCGNSCEALAGRLKEPGGHLSC